MKLGLAVLLMCIVSLALTVPTQTAALLEGVASESELTTCPLDSDSTFEVEPDVIYGANRTCFSHWYQQDFQGTDQNVVCINWTHQAGVQYNYSYVYPPTGPECADYVALRIPLACPYNTTPMGLKGRFVARILSTGDFVGQEWSADILACLVTEAGYWYGLQFDRPDAGLENFSSGPFGASRQLFEYELPPPIDDEQPPTSILGSTFDIVLFLAPDAYFSQVEIGGWGTMSGTVSVMVCGFSAEVLLHNSTAVETLQPYRGEHLNMTNAWPRGSVAVDPSGASYCLFETLDDHFLVKWDSDLRIVCNQSLGFPDAHFSGIQYHGGCLYCYGFLSREATETYAFLVCTDLEASVLWFREYHISSRAYALAAETDGDDSLIVTGYGYSAEMTYFSWMMAVLPDGTPLWNTTFPAGTSEFYTIYAVHEERFYCVSSYDGFPLCYSLDGELLWRGETACNGVTVGPGGHIYAWVQDYSNWGGWWAWYTIFRYDSYGNVLWNRTVEVTYPGGWDDSLYMLALDIRSDGRLSAAFILHRYLDRAILYSVSADGESETVGTLSDSTPYGSSGYEMPFSIRGLDGFFLVLIASYAEPGIVYTMLSYDGPALDASSSDLPIILGTAGAAALLVGWIVYDRVGSHRLAERLKRRNENSG